MSLISPIICGTEYSFLNILKKIIKKDTDGNYYIGTVGSDSVIPFPVDAEVGLIADNVIAFNFSEPLDDTSIPAVGDFTINGTTNPTVVTLVTIVGSVMRLTLSVNVLWGDVVTVDYTSGVDPLRDVAGNLCASFIAFPVTNNVVDIVAPSPSTSEVGNAAANIVVIVFDEALNNAITPAVGTFVVNGMADPAATTGVLVIGSAVRLTLATDVYFGDVVTVTYTQPGVNPLQDPAGNLAASFVAFATTNNVAVVAQYATVLTAMVTDPVGNDVIYQNRMLKRLVARGYFAKAELIDIFSTHTNGGSEAIINWKSPGTFDPSLVNAPVFAAYQGFTGNDAANRCVRLNFIPSTNGTLISQNSLCIIIGVGTNVGEDKYDCGSSDAADGTFIMSRSGTGNFSSRCNDATTNLVANASSIGHFTISRGAAAGYAKYKNLVKTDVVQASTGVVGTELYACAINANGTIIECSKQIRYILVLSYLTELEENDVIGIMESYLDSVGTGLI